MEAVMLAMDQAEANGPGVYCARSGVERAICCWNPEHDPVIEAEFQRRLSYLNKGIRWQK